MYLDMNTLPVVDERMVDIVLLELLHIDAQFREWFFDLIAPCEGSLLSFVAARHSVFETSSGETDIEAVCASADGTRMGFLIENKVYAPFMPRQLERYRMRGEEGCVSGKWDVFRVVLVAPQRYLTALAPEERRHLDAEIPYEAISRWIGLSGQGHLGFKRHLLEKAIASGRKGYVKQVDAAMTKFWHDYWSWLRASGSPVSMQEPQEKGRSSSWIDFMVPWQAPKCRLYHKFLSESVELVVNSRDAAAAERLIAPLLEEGMRFKATDTTVSACISVPAMDHRREFAGQLPQAMQALAQAERLLALAVTASFRHAVVELSKGKPAEVPA
jgi:hypothetical protein